jgi:hypothetical protein
MPPESREQWEQELRDRQSHNYVFPGTMINSTAALRKLVNRPLRGPLQKIGFLLWASPLLLLSVLAALIFEGLHSPDFAWSEAAANIGMGLGAILGVLALAGLVIGIAYSIQSVLDLRAQHQATRVRLRLQMPLGRLKRRR